ncbi:MAG: S9 family peptidase [Pseudomonadales bacterium]|nr:S9 family peptidase [Pseudomonadales bacterium]MDP6470037.1 S9 family peptidase [Pseudomonadales bacterium]MDP6826938.1 S9 family peptidase [Pseudomonadales bacterium]MDP6971035.1 S9 family peptidase [Pseudomonadales bacterium]|tara:strand:- start:7028 stop:9109 length:2082 start_codon:yes stop_codon:yes gene_type:complete
MNGPRFGILIVMGVLWLGGCSDPAQDSAATAAEPGEQEAAAPFPLIPRGDVFGNPTRIQGRISPDGKHLSWLAPVDGVLNIWVADASDPSTARAVTQERERGVAMHFWSPDSRFVLYLQDSGGNENHHVYAADIESGEVRDLTPVGEATKATIEAVSRQRPDRVLVGLNERNPQLFDLYEITISTGEQKLIVENPGFVGFVADHNLEPRLALKQVVGSGVLVMKSDGEGGWSEWLSIPAEDVLTTNVVGFTADNEHVYITDSRERDTTALTLVSLEDGAAEVVAEDPRADISNVVIDPVTYEVTAYAVDYTRVEWHALTDGAQDDLEYLRARLDGDLSFLSGTADGIRAVVHSEAAQAPGTYYLFDRDARTLDRMFDTRPELADAQLQPMHPVEVTSRDGLTLVSYVTLPPGSDTDGDGLPEQPVPMVLLVHGGPWARDAYGYNSTHQWLANRGYAVLSVNYRGSTGFGKTFVNAAIGEFAGKMHDDLIDAVNWAIASKITSSGQVAIMGGSYGGYATLVGVTFTPDSFECGVDIVGPSSLVTLVESFPPYWAPFLESTWFKYVGNPANEAQRADMFNRSPISRVKDIQVPLLIGQGQNDPRVTKLESDQLVAAMGERDLPVTYLNYPDEGHGFARPENRMSFFAVTEGFLAGCLGGRFEPIGDDFEGSSVEVVHGAEYVSGFDVSTGEASGV